jgi:hypothetical protein
MILEGLVAAACTWGNSDACNAGLSSYVKVNKLDERAQTIEQNFKKQHAGLHLTFTTLGIAVQNKYKLMIYRDFWVEADYSDKQNQKTLILYKKGF